MQHNRVITVHASLNSSKVLVCLIKPEIHSFVVNQVRNVSEVMLVRLLVFIETLPEFSIIFKWIVITVTLALNKYDQR